MAGFISRKASVPLLFFSLGFIIFPAAAPAPSLKPQPLTALCNSTTNPSLCLATLSKYPSSQRPVLLQNLTAFIVSQAFVRVNRTYWIGKKIAARHEDAADGRFTLQDCLEMLVDARDGLNRSIDRLTHLSTTITPASGLHEQVMDVRVWLSSSLTYLDTCWGELSDPKAAPLKAQFSTINHDIEPLLAIALSLAQTLQQDGGSSSYKIPRHHGSSPPSLA